MFSPVAKEIVYRQAIKEPTENYFILQSLIKAKSPYKALYADDALKVFILQRHSGTVQIFTYGALTTSHMMALNQWVQTNSFTQIVTTQPIGDLILQNQPNLEKRIGSTIAKTHHLNVVSNDKACCKSLTLEDLERVEEIYKQVFTGYASLSYMKQKITSGRGRGFGVWVDEKLVSVAQSDFETEKSAVVVGVATDPEYMGEGYGTEATAALCRSLLEKPRQLGLIYENDIAGKIYKRLGFIDENCLYHMERRRV